MLAVASLSAQARAPSLMPRPLASLLAGAIALAPREPPRWPLSARELLATLSALHSASPFLLPHEPLRRH